MNKDAFFKASILLNSKGEYKKALTFLQHALEIDEQRLSERITGNPQERLIQKGLFYLNLL